MTHHTATRPRRQPRHAPAEKAKRDAPGQATRPAGRVAPTRRWSYARAAGVAARAVRQRVYRARQARAARREPGRSSSPARGGGGGGPGGCSRGDPDPEPPRSQDDRGSVVLLVERVDAPDRGRLVAALVRLAACHVRAQLAPVRP